MWKRLRRFELLELLGEGGQGSVYKALRRDRAAQLEQTVALKILHSKTAVELWRQEFESLSRVRSKYCVRVLSFERWRRRPALVLEYIEGISLNEGAQAGLFNPQDVAEIAAQLDQALRELHAQSVYHGDLSPQNILIDREGSVRLLDFGLANCGNLRLTPAFAAPERLQGAAVSCATDLYSLGKTLELLGHSSDRHLHLDPKKRDFGDELPREERRKPLAAKIRAYLERRALAKSRRTQTLSLTRPSSHSSQLLLIVSIILCTILATSSTSHSTRPPPLATLRLQSESWRYFKLNGLPLGYAPLTLAVPAHQTQHLTWVSPVDRGAKDLTLNTQEMRLLRDRDFSH